MRHMNTEFYEYILRERGRRDVDEDKDDSMCASLPHVYSPAQPARGTVSRRLRSTQYGENMSMTRPVKTDFRNVVLRGKQSCCGYSKVPKPYGLCTKTMHFS